MPRPPASTARPERVAERRLVSVLFADLVGFTTLSESRDAEEVRELLVPLLRDGADVDRTLRRHGREVHRRRGHGGLGNAGHPGGRRRASRPGGARPGRGGRGARRRGRRARSERAGRRRHRRGRRDVARRGPGHGRRRSGEHRRARPVGGGARHRLRDRWNPPRERSRRRLRRRRHPRPEGQGRAAAPVPRGPRDRGQDGSAPLRRARVAVRRSRPRVPAGEGPLPRHGRRAAGAPRVGARHRRDRQVAHRVGVREVRRRRRRRRVLASRPLHPLRRGRQLLGARRDGAHARRASPKRRILGRAPRSWRTRWRRGSPTRTSAATSGRDLPRSSATTTTPPPRGRTCRRVGGCSSSGSPSEVRPCSSSRICNGPTTRCWTSSRRCSISRATGRCSS